jgi:hypothetical protein
MGEKHENVRSDSRKMFANSAQCCDLLGVGFGAEGAVKGWGLILVQERSSMNDEGSAFFSVFHSIFGFSVQTEL